MTQTQVSVLLFPRDFLFRQDTNFLLFAIIRHPVCMFFALEGKRGEETTLLTWVQQAYLRCFFKDH